MDIPSKSEAALELPAAGEGVPVADETQPTEPTVARWRRLPKISEETVIRALRDVILPIVAIRLGIMAFGYLALAVFAPENLAQGMSMWNHWDGPNFQILASTGYGPNTAHPEWIVLFPLYPITIDIGKLVFSSLDSAMLSSLLATLAAGLGLYELVRLDASKQMARLSVLAMVLFPTAYSLVAPYSEALFLALTVWAFVAVRRDHMATAGILGLLAALTRIQGAFLIPALGIEYLMIRRRIDRDVLWIGLPVAGPLIYLAINWFYFGSPMHFVDVQQQVYNVHNQMPWLTMQNLWNGVMGTKQDEHWVTVFIAPLASYVILLVVTIWSAVSKHSRPSYAVYTAFTALSFTTLSWPISVPRYIMGVFPIFMAIGSWSRLPGGQAILYTSTLLLGLFTTLFLMFHWAF